MRAGIPESARRLEILLLALPLIVWLSIPPLLFGLSLFDYVPGYDNDEIHYWHEILTFREVGFSGGYYTVDELPARSLFSPFGTEGPAFTVVYGSVAKVFGWHLFSPAFYNAVALFVCLAAMYRLARPPLNVTVWMAALIVTYWPLALVAPTVMQEPLHHAAAILFAGIFFGFVQRRSSRGPRYWLGALSIGVMSTIRYTWSAFLAPFLFLTSTRSRPKILLGCVAFGSLAFLLAFWWSAPYPRYTLWRDMTSGYAWVHEWVLWNSSNFFRLVDEPYGTNEAYLGLLLRCQITGVVLYAGWKLWIALRDRDVTERSLMLLILFSLSHIVVAQVLFYSVDNYHDYRVFGPYLLFSLILLVLFKRLGIVSAVILSNLIAAPAFLGAYAVRNIEGVDYVRAGTPSKNDPSGLKEFEKELEGKLLYTPDADRWCNTLLARPYRTKLVAVPAGIGLSALLDASELALPPKSKYILLAENDPLLRTAELRLERLASTTEGTLHYNLDSGCAHSEQGRDGRARR